MVICIIRRNWLIAYSTFKTPKNWVFRQLWRTQTVHHLSKIHFFWGNCSNLQWRSADSELDNTGATRLVVASGTTPPTCAIRYSKKYICLFSLSLQMYSYHNCEEVGYVWNPYWQTLPQGVRTECLPTEEFSIVVTTCNHDFCSKR